MRVLLVARSEERGREVLAELHPGGGHELYLADLSSMAQVQRVAQQIAAAHETIDVLVNNAGAINMQRELTVDGYERTFATNHLAYFLLTKLLLDRVGWRVVIVASNAHMRAKGIHFEDLSFERGYSGLRVYDHSKLCNVMFTYELARRLRTAGSKVTANSLHPGVIASGFGRNDPGWFRFIVKLGSPFLMSPEKGARTTIYLASSDQCEGVTGEFWDKCKVAKSTRVSHDEAQQRRLWEISEEMVKKWASL
jgi:NAD(P)-dependent dehydrogenase (short-subunit alcohol dehydrogenase family)